MLFQRDALAFSMLLLAGVLAAWLGIWGPINFDFNKLKDWQPLMAATIALGAGFLAYTGAIAKVRFDRETIERDLKRQRSRLMMRVSYALTMLHFDVEQMLKSTGEKLQDKEAYPSVILKDLIITEPPELDEAWNNLDIFDVKVISALTRTKVAFRSMKQTLSSLSPEVGIDIDSRGIRYLMLDWAVLDHCLPIATDNIANELRMMREK